MTEFKAGQRVKVEYEGTITSTGNGVAWVKPDGRPGVFQSGRAPVGTLTLLDSPDWPPQVGDIWELSCGSLKGYEFFIAKKGDGETLAKTQDGGMAWDLETLKNHDPVLVRRRGQ